MCKYNFEALKVGEVDCTYMNYPLSLCKGVLQSTSTKWDVTIKTPLDDELWTMNFDLVHSHLMMHAK